MTDRPENQLPPELFYNLTEASKYESNTRIQTIQRQMAERAIELLNLEQNSFVMDIGCGSGISGEVLTENNYIWEGIDISRDMLDLATAK
jgi:18S rRNA (guanine1575-N7)-methyltransferase